jgi:hypothetical protein
MTYDSSGHSLVYPFFLNSFKACGGLMLDLLGYAISGRRKFSTWLTTPTHSPSAKEESK